MRKLESVIKEWRIATIKAGEALKGKNQIYSNTVACEMLEDISPFLSDKDDKFKRQGALADLEKICFRVMEMALAFRSSNIDYTWEQLVPAREVSKLSPDLYTVIGSEGPKPEESRNFEVSFAVFGGVVRGDKATGSLSQGKTRLSPAEVVVRDGSGREPRR